MQAYAILLRLSNFSLPSCLPSETCWQAPIRCFLNVSHSFSPPTGTSSANGTHDSIHPFSCFFTTLTDAFQLHREVERGIRRNHSPRPSRTVPQSRGNDHIPLLSNLHLQQGLIPTRDDLPDARAEGQGLSTVVGRVELLGRLEVVQPTRVVNLNGLPC